jgi:hypothetical protein
MTPNGDARGNAEMAEDRDWLAGVKATLEQQVQFDSVTVDCLWEAMLIQAAIDAAWFPPLGAKPVQG